MKSPQAMTERTAGVKSAVRVLDVLEFFARTMEPATLARLCTELDMPKSSGHALMETLRQQGYLYWLGKHHGYYPTRRWRDQGEAITRHDPILSMASETLHRISSETGETAILAKREENHVLYLEVVEPDRTLRFSAYAGQIKPMHSAASGRALLALIDSEERNKVLRQLKLVAYSDRTVTDINRLKQVIVDGEAAGYHVAIGEYQSDTTAIAVGFRFGTECYALLVGGPTQRLEGHIEEIGHMLISRAAQLAG
ncbi:IclR family transcriptional regulator [Parapusillimonas granuli]|uniref:IclR family transcriptional regulator n=1 Tax=Parapusillimonas granuli TaxID=380911 RepID=A0A853G034_9BURK|nr:IclR family transcriptional regulator [Parapusillimonas granuli]MBB5215674.1 DNA-binding IclR family transcriptional regulator [Parapusillimonas granuli]NYT49659.1 IclR family transcriptional regulator [Parapusillimonas granuli]